MGISKENKFLDDPGKNAKPIWHPCFASGRLGFFFKKKAEIQKTKQKSWVKYTA